MFEVVRGSCLDLSAEQLRGFHAMITDPPYSQYVHDHAMTIGSGRGPRKRDFGFARASRALRRGIASFAPRMSGWSLIFSDLESAHLWRYAVQAQFVRTVVLDDAGRADYEGAIPWVRWSQPQLSGDRPPSGSEVVSVFWGGQGRKMWWGPGGLTSFRRRCLRGANKHPTEKPLDLMLDIVSWFTNFGQCVFDPCAGLGTTGLACRLLGREFFGCEIDAEWQMRAAERLTVGLSDRDRARAEEWCLASLAEENRVAVLPNRQNAGAIARAVHRREDIERVAACLR